ncbi:uncharacterized protein LOC115639528 [Gopherus evgoodei]|uniref:uncharacterized protein LOC115639528 n=1 Tax=Gopherus evgoodei TaxID=1825980 RepID=UPI0011CF5317|nr:uncharacterized protein LOC115639528 [Gopherus evgoodei]
MGPAMGLLLCSLLLLAPGGLRLSSGQVQLEGLVGESVYFPALSPVARDIVRVLWFSERQGTHIAEAKPQGQAFNVNFLPNFSNRLAIHAGNLSLEIRHLRLEDQGPYRAVVDIASDPTKPRAFSYELSVRERGQEGDRGKGGTTDPPGGGERRTSTGPPAEGAPVTTGRRTTLAGGDGGGQEGGESQGSCHCTLKGYVIAAVYVPLCAVVAIVHVKTRG